MSCNTFVAVDERTVTADAAVGTSVMRAAKGNGVDGIEGDFGGACARATGHVYVAPEWAGSVGRASEEERDMLDCANGARETSRMSCQILVNDELEHLIAHLPLSQG